MLKIISFSMFLLASTPNNYEISKQEIELLKSFIKPKYAKFSDTLVANLYSTRVVETGKVGPGYYGNIFPKEGDWLESIAKKVNLAKHPLTVLGLGSACGYVELYLAACGAKAKVIDISQAEIEIGRAIAATYGLHSSISFINENVLTMENHVGQYDFVICRNLIHFMKKSEENLLLTKIQQNLIPKTGRAIISCDFETGWDQNLSETEYTRECIVISNKFTQNMQLYANSKVLSEEITDALAFKRNYLLDFKIVYEEKAKIIGREKLANFSEDLVAKVSESAVLQAAEIIKKSVKENPFVITLFHLETYKRFLSVSYLKTKAKENNLNIISVKPTYFGPYLKNVMIANKLA